MNMYGSAAAAAAVDPVFKNGCADCERGGRWEGGGGDSATVVVHQQR